MAKPKKFIVGGLLNIGAGVGTAAFSYAQRQKALRQMAQLDQAEQGNIMTMAARNRVARQESDAQSAIDAGGRATATQLAAAQEAGGSRAVQSISPQVVRASEEATARSLQQFGNMGSQISREQDASMLTASQGRIGQQRDALQRSADMATQNMTQGIGLGLAGVAETAGGLAGLGKNNKDSGTARNVASSSSNRLSVTPTTNILDLAAQQRADIEKMFGKAKDGMVVKTPGSFSHKSNPIDVIKDGKKIAEMTGGEYIFNPKQSQKLRTLAGDGTSTLHKFVRELLSKSQFK